MRPLDLDPATIVALANSQLREVFSWVRDTTGNPFVGGEYQVYVLVNQTQSRRIFVRIPKAPPGDFITSLRLKSEADIRLRIDSAKLSHFQPLLACDPTADNMLGHPFMVLGWADGNPLTWSEDTPKCQVKRKGVLQAIANTNLDLLQIQQHGASALEWIRAKIDRKIARAMANNFPHEMVSECEKQKSLIARYWMPDIDDTPHVLVHGDLSSNKIIVDNNVEVKSVIDLGWAEMIPLQRAAEYPRFLTYEPVESDSGFAWTNRTFPQLSKDRLYYLACVEERAVREGGLALWYYLILSRTDELNRYWWYTAASRADIRKAMAKCDCDPMSAINQEVENN